MDTNHNVAHQYFRSDGASSLMLHSVDCGDNVQFDVSSPEATVNSATCRLARPEQILNRPIAAPSSIRNSSSSSGACYKN
jgi:hypothetical protein